MYTKKHVIEKLQEVAQELGKTPSSTYWGKNHITPSLPVIVKLFGTWNNALETAGLSPNAILDYTHESLIAKLHEVAQELGRTPTKTYWEEHHIKPTAPVYQKAFGSWNKALKTASLTTSRENTSREEVIADIFRVVEQLGHTPTMNEYLELGRFSHPTVYKHLFHWHETMERLGLAPASSAPVTRERVLASVQAVVDDLGEVPLATDYELHPSGYALNTFYKHFETYDDALLELGLEPPPDRWTKSKPQFSEEELLGRLKAIADELGRSPSAEESRALGLSPNTLSYRFGSFNNALRLVNLETREPLSSKHVICKDGHIVDSIVESTVDNFLFENGIPHAIHVRVCPERRWTCDFVVKDLWIEVDGLGDKRLGLDGFNEKITFYKENGYLHLVINPYQDKDWQSRLLAAVDL